jgi:hypothetical protein
MHDQSLSTRATTLYPLVPSGPDFARSLEFFVAIGFETGSHRTRSSAMILFGLTAGCRLNGGEHS